MVKRPVQPVPAIPANPPKPEENKRKLSAAPKSPTPKSPTPKSPTTKSPVMLRKERKKSTPPETTGRRPVSIVLEPDSLQVKGGVHQSLSEPNMQSVGTLLFMSEKRPKERQNRLTRGSKTMAVWSRKYPYPPHRGSLEILGV